MILRITTPASAWIEDTNEMSAAIFTSLNGVTHDEAFSEYFIDDVDPFVRQLRVQGGMLSLAYNALEKTLSAFVDYGTESPLTSTQAEALIAYTLGQLSDGIGNNFVQEYVEKTGIFVEIQVLRKDAKLEYL